VAEGSKFVDPAIAVDRQGAVWLVYTDADGTWVERRGR
jgi:beta-xylosidase